MSIASGASVVGEQLRDSGRTFANVLRNKGLRRINLALLGSVIGDWAYNIAVAVWAYRQGGASALGAFGVARFVVLAVLSPVLSTLADRHPRKLVMIGSDLVRAVLVVVALVSMAAGAPDLVVYGLALATAAAGLAFRPAQAALLPALASDPTELAGANVVASSIESIGFFVGPALGALLLAVADIEVVYAFNALTFLWSAAMLVGLPHGAPVAAESGTDESEDGEDGEDAGFRAETAAGFGTILRHRDLRLVAALYAAQTVVAGASLVFEVAIVIELLGLGESTVGLVDSVLGVGGLVGGIVAMGLVRRQRIATDFGVGVMLWSAPLLLIVAFPTIGATAAAMFLIGVANSLVDINAYTIIQRLAPPEVMGRVFGALESIVIAGMALGALLMPLLINTIGLRPGLAVVGTGVAAVALAGLAGLRRIDATVLAPAGLDLLRGVPTLSVLPPPVLERLAQSATRSTVPAGQVVFREGDDGDRFWVIERGRAAVTIAGQPVRELGPGGSFGEIALLRDVPRTATVTAAGEADLELLGLGRDDFVPAVTGHGEASEVADAVVERWLGVS